MVYFGEKIWPVLWLSESEKLMGMERGKKIGNTRFNGIDLKTDIFQQKQNKHAVMKVN